MPCSASATAWRSSWKLFTFSSNVATVPSVSVARSSTLGRSTRDTLLVDSTTSTRQLHSGGASAQQDDTGFATDAPQALQVRQRFGRLHRPNLPPRLLRVSANPAKGARYAQAH
jgi:hypothetical protein